MDLPKLGFFRFSYILRTDFAEFFEFFLENLRRPEIFRVFIRYFRYEAADPVFSGL